MSCVGRRDLGQAAKPWKMFSQTLALKRPILTSRSFCLWHCADVLLLMCMSQENVIVVTHNLGHPVTASITITLGEQS